MQVFKALIGRTCPVGPRPLCPADGGEVLQRGNSMRIPIVCLFFAVCASWVHATTHQASIDVSFPDELAGLSFVGRKEFPQKELGSNLAYEGGGFRGSVFIYTGGLRSIPDGIESEKIQKHFAQVIDEVKQMASLGKVRAVSFTDSVSHRTAFKGCGPQFLWRGYEMVFNEGFTLSSYTYLTALNDNFVKLRISYRQDAPIDKRDVERFVLALRKVLGKCPA